MFSVYNFSHAALSVSTPFLSLYFICRKLAAVVPLSLSLCWCAQMKEISLSLELLWYFFISVMEFIFYFILWLSPLLEKDLLDCPTFNVKLYFSNLVIIFILPIENNARVKNGDFSKMLFLFNLFTLYKLCNYVLKWVFV